MLLGQVKKLIEAVVLLPLLKEMELRKKAFVLIPDQQRLGHLDGSPFIRHEGDSVFALVQPFKQPASNLSEETILLFVNGNTGFVEMPLLLKNKLRRFPFARGEEICLDPNIFRWNALCDNAVSVFVRVAYK